MAYLRMSRKCSARVPPVSIYHILATAVAVAMDAFAVSVSSGVALYRVTSRHTLRMALWFGAFQGLMPVLGWFGGSSVRGYVGGYDHWVAFGLLTGLGGKVIWDSLTGGESERLHRIATPRMFVLAVATSIDALLVGISLAMMGVNILLAALIIGLVTGIMSALGMEMGDHLLGVTVGKYAEIIGGMMLVGIGVETLVRHLA